LNLAVKWYIVAVSHNLLGLSEEAQIQGDDLRNATFLALYKREKNYLATGTKIWKDNSCTEMFRLAKDVQLNPDELRYKLLLDQAWDGQPAWFLAAKRDNVKLLEELRVFRKRERKPRRNNIQFIASTKPIWADCFALCSRRQCGGTGENVCFFLKKPNLTKTN
jgi:hypothetical protein